MSSDFSLGPYTDVVLDNGLRVVVQEVHSSPVASMHFSVHTGSAHELNRGHGLSHYLEHMIFKGSEKFPGKTEIADRVQNCGGYINAYTSKDHTNYYIDVTAGHVPEMLDLLVDAVTAPLFPEDEFITEKEVILSEQAMYEDSPSYVMQQTSWEMLGHAHPFSMPVIGLRKKIEEVDRQLMVDYYKLRYRPTNAALVVVGDVDTEEVLAQIRQTAGNWTAGPLAPVILPKMTEKQCYYERDLYFKDPHSRLMTSFVLPPEAERDVAVLDVIEYILSGSQSSVLVRDLKKKERLVLSATAMSFLVPIAGVFSITAATDSEKMEEVETRIFEILDDIKQGKVLKEDIDRAVLRTKLSFLKQLHSVSNRAQLITTAVYAYDSPNYWEAYVHRLEQVTIEDVQKVCARYLDREKSVVVRQFPMESVRKKVQMVNGEATTKSEAQTIVLGDAKIKFLNCQYKDSPFVDFTILFPGGAMDDPAEKAGTSMMLRRLMRSGTAQYSEEELAQYLDDNGISLGFVTGANTFRCDVSCLHEKLEETLNILSEILLAPTFLPDIFEREKATMLALHESKKQKLFAPGQNAFCAKLYPGHPYTFRADGTSESIANITLDDVREYYRKMFRRESVVISAAGDFDQSHFESLLQPMLTKIEWHDKKELDVTPPAFEGGREDLTVDLPRDQALVMFGMPGCRASEPARYVVELLTTILNGQSSRIFKSVREEAGLAYDTGLMVKMGIHAGYLVFYALTKPESAKEALGLLEKEAESLAENGITEEELHDAILQYSSDRAFDGQDHKVVAVHNAINEYYGLGSHTFHLELEEIKALKLEEVNKMIQLYCRHPRKISVIAGNMELVK